MARQYNVTSTITTNLVKYKAFNPDTEEVTERTCTYKIDDNLSQEKKLYAIRNKVDWMACKVTEVSSVNATYGMTEATFIKYASKLDRENDSRRDLITRTMKASMVKIQVFKVDEPTKGLQFMTVAMDTGFDTLTDDKKIAMVRKAYETDTLKIVMVHESTPFDELYGMSRDTFMKHGVELDPVTRQPLKADSEDNADTEDTEG